jgi:hypothetical protein
MYQPTRSKNSKENSLCWSSLFSSDIRGLGPWLKCEAVQIPLPPKTREINKNKSVIWDSDLRSKYFFKVPSCSHMSSSSNLLIYFSKMFQPPVIHEALHIAGTLVWVKQMHSACQGRQTDDQSKEILEKEAKQVATINNKWISLRWGAGQSENQLIVISFPSCRLPWSPPNTLQVQA